MLKLDTHTDLITIDQIAVVCDISRRAVTKKKGTQAFFGGYIIKANGQRIKGYTSNVTLQWIDSPEKAKVALEKLRRKPRNDKGKTRKISAEIEKEFADKIFEEYMNQARADNMLSCCRDAAYKMLLKYGNIGKYIEEEALAQYFYKQRLKRKTGTYVGIAHRDKWEMLHKSKYNMKAMNNYLPKNSYNYFAMLMNAELIGKGFGSSDLWVIDGTQLDAWIAVEKLQANGSYKRVHVLVNYIKIMDGVTGYPLIIMPIESESITSTLRALAACYEKYGVPRMGVVMDNGRAFKSATVQGFIRSFYSDDELERFKTDSRFQQIFGNISHAPCWFNIPNIPQYPFKSKIERSFREDDKFAQTRLADTYQGGQRGKGTLKSMSLTPVLKNAPHAEDAWAAFSDWMYGSNLKRLATGTYKEFKRLTGEACTCEAVWNYYGAENNFKKMPDENLATAMFWYSAEEDKRRVRQTKLGHIFTTYKRRQYNYHCPDLELEYIGLKITIVINPENPRKAALYLEHNPKEFNKHCPNEGDVYLIGPAQDQTITTVEEAAEFRPLRQANQRRQQKVLDDAAANITIDPMNFHSLGSASKADLQPVPAPVEIHGNGADRTSPHTDNYLPESNEADYSIVDPEAEDLIKNQIPDIADIDIDDLLKDY